MTEQDLERIFYHAGLHRWTCYGDAVALIAEVRRLRADYANLDESLEAHGKKLESLSPHGTCGCSYDAPSHLCAHHSPQLTEALGRNRELEAEIYRLRELRADALRQIELVQAKADREIARLKLC